MKKFTQVKAGKYFNKVLSGTPDIYWKLQNAWSDNFNRWYCCDGFRGYRIESEPIGATEWLDNGHPYDIFKADYDKTRLFIESVFDRKSVFDETIPIEVNFDEVLSIAKKDKKAVIDLGENYPCVNAQYLREAMELFPDGKVYCNNGARRMFLPIYIVSDYGIAFIYPIRRENKLHWKYNESA